MKVIDKRKKSKDEDWNVGDVVCYWDDYKSKKYGLIVKLMDGYYIALIETDDTKDSGYLSWNGYRPAISIIKSTSISGLIDNLVSMWTHVKKVNAHLVVED